MQAIRHRQYLLFDVASAEVERFNISLSFPIIISHFVFPLSLLRQEGRVKRTQALESMRSTFVP